MRIDSSTIGMESARTYSSFSSRIRKVTITSGWQSLEEGTDALLGNDLESGVDENAQTTGQKEGAEKEALESQSSKDFFKSTMEEMSAKVQAVRINTIASQELEKTQRHLSEIRQQCLEYLMQLFFPDKYDKDYGLYEESGSGEQDVSSLSSEQGWQPSWMSAQSSQASLASSGAAHITTFQFSYQYYHEEKENTTFSTQGTVRCADGREISFNLNVEMSRSFQEYYEENINITQFNLCDPLVINLEGNVAELSDQTFFFDLDADGTLDEISQLQAASGFLALDKNEDGTINDGSELFGTQSGNGFEDLAAYDEDGNDFIDEGDSIWDKLRIWVMDENGNAQLCSLAEKGVGAICLMNTDTDFTLKGQSNQTNGVIRRTGFFLFEDGNAGTIQHVDLAMQSSQLSAKQEEANHRYEQAIYGLAM